MWICKDCGREMSQSVNANNTGWVMAGGDAFCPICLRLGACEKEVLECQRGIIILKSQIEILKAAGDYKIILADRKLEVIHG